MKALASIFGCVVFAAWVFAASGGTDAVSRGSGAVGSLDQRWGPDAFGYRALDSAEPGGPPVRWFDISATGTEVTGLTDDNFVGPFPIGFSFRYYWYDVTQFWVGSNGYIKFSTPGQLAQPFPQFPNATAPNDVVGPYVADWFFGPVDPSRCYYRTIGTDTLIVMWKDVTAWFATGNQGNHNFEIVLARADSSITFYYGAQTGLVSNNNVAIGIENLTGQIGISTHFGVYPPANYAIKFDYPDSISYSVHDLAIAGVQNSISGGFFMLPGDTLRPWLAVRNAGNQTESGFTINYSVRNLSNAVLAQRDSVLGTLLPSQRADVQFEPLWTAAAPAVYRAVGTVTLANDAYQANNTVRAELRTVSLPGELAYDDGVSDRDWGWSGGQGGMAMQFVPPVYPVEITQVRIYVVTTQAQGFDAQIIDDDGPAGAPGTILWSQHLDNPPAAAFSSFVVPEGQVVIQNGSFYVAWMQSVEGITFGIDSTSAGGISRRAWEFAGGWAENRLAQEADAMIRCSIRLAAPPNNPPGPFSRVAPEDSSRLVNLQAPFTLHWTRSLDIDGDNIMYLLDIRNDFDSSMHFSTVDTSLTDYLFPLWPPPSEAVSRVMWTVYATDGRDTIEASNGEGFFFIWLDIAVEDNDPPLPRDIALSSYPNPFNPATEIRYDLPQAAAVELLIYDLLGRHVTTLVNTRNEPGRYRVQWNAAEQPSGMYFAVLRAGQTTKLHKLLLLK